MFFSVKSSVKILNKVYTPCICYEITDVLAPTIDKMVEEGKAYIYYHKVAFQNGKVLEKKAEEKPAVTKKSKRAKKEEINEEEDIPSPEEIAEEF